MLGWNWLVDSGSVSSLSLHFGMPSPIKNTMGRGLYLLPHSGKQFAEDFCTYPEQPLFSSPWEVLPSFLWLVTPTFISKIFSVYCSLASTVFYTLHLLPRDILLHLTYQIMTICL